MADPMHQFQIQKIVELPTVTVFGMPIDLSITNSVAAMLLAATLLSVFYVFASAKRAVVTP